MKIAGFISVLLTVSSLFIFADPVADKIDTYIRAGQPDEAKAFIVSCIEDNPADICDLIDKYIIIEKDIEKVISFLKEIENSVTDSYKYYIYKNLGFFEEMYGRIDSSQKYYHNAAVTAPAAEQAGCYFESARLLYELGNIDMAVIELSSVFLISSSLELLSRAYVLKGHLVRADEDYEDAEELYSLVINNYRGYSGETEALFSMIIMNYYNLADKQEAEKYLSILEDIAPGSPEYQIAYNLINKLESNIDLAVTPQRFLEYYMINDASEPVPESEHETLDSRRAEEEENNDITIYVQTGSFIIKENAEYMVLDLSDAGFKADIMSTYINNTLYYKVVIGTFNSNEEANSVLIRIRESGFQGFLLFK